MTLVNPNKLELPNPPLAQGAYSPVVIRRGIGFVSGQFPILEGKLAYSGRVGIELDEDEGREACRLAGLNVLAQIHKATNGFKNVEAILCLEGHIASDVNYHRQPKILDAASDLFVEYLGPKIGEHARTIFSPVSLPLNSPVELCVSFALKEQ